MRRPFYAPTTDELLLADRGLSISVMQISIHGAAGGWRNGYFIGLSVLPHGSNHPNLERIPPHSFLIRILANQSPGPTPDSIKATPSSRFLDRLSAAASWSYSVHPRRSWSTRPVTSFRTCCYYAAQLSNHRHRRSELERFEPRQLRVCGGSTPTRCCARSRWAPTAGFCAGR